MGILGQSHITSRTCTQIYRQARKQNSCSYSHDAIDVSLRSLRLYRSITIASLRPRKFAHVAIAHVHSLIQTSYVHTFKPHIYNYMNGEFLTMYVPIC